jgi:tetratricopeptide (TPR) repeat protein
VAFSRALRIFYRVLAKNHKYRKWTDTAISEVFHEMDDPDDYNSYKAALDDSISREVAGDSFRKNKLFSQAILEYRAAIEFLQGYHPDSADLHSKIAIILRRMGEFDKALEENRFALEIYELSLGPEHPETVKTLNRTMEKKRFNQLSLALLEKLDLEN